MIILLLAFVLAATGPEAPTRLRIEYLDNPMGVSAAHPRLSWVVNDPRRGAIQAGYRVLAASSPDRLGRDEADLWDSGTVSSRETIQIEYAGKPLTSNQRLWWKVRTLDGSGQSSPWSAPATWTMGLLTPSDWKAQWIGLPGGGTPATVAHNGYHSQMARSADEGRWVTIDLGQLQTVDAIRLWPARPIDWTKDAPGFMFPVRFKVEASDNPGFSAASVVVDKTTEDQPSPGTEARLYSFAAVQARFIRLTATRLAPRDPGEFGLALAEMEVLSKGSNLARGKPVTAQDSIEHNHWSTTRLTDGITLSQRGHDAVRGPSPMLRTTAKLDAAPVRATLFVTARGLYEFRINGRRVGDPPHQLAPEWTDYSRRIQYQTYDVTSLLHAGDNALGAILGDGWYAGRIGFLSNQMYGDQTSLLAQVLVEFPDGSSRTLTTGPDWKATLEGPIRSNDILDGEMYDARREIPGWDSPAFDDSKWLPAQVFPAPSAAIVNQPNEPIRITREIKPVAISEPAPNTYIVDFGQNLPGWVRLNLSGPAGAKVELTHAEMLDDKGRVYTTNLRSASQRDTIILSGQSFTYEPRFTYHGFRYVEVTGLPSRTDLDSIVARVAHSSCPEAGTFECSNPMLNRLEQNVRWTQYANLMSVPTDCPQRNERMGWMGDAHIFAETGIHNLDMAAFFAKWSVDIRDAQSPEGAYSDVSPNPSMKSGQFISVPGWGDAGVAMPFRLYHHYGDIRLLAEHYESARKWIDYIRAKNPSLIWEKARGNDYGDWLNADTLKLEGFPSKGAEVPKEIFATVCFESSTRMLAKMAAALGKQDEAEQYSLLADKIRDEFRKRFIAPDGKMPGDTQAGYAFALRYDLAPEPLRPAMVQHLLSAINTRGGHLSTGFHSTIPMMDELVRSGHADIAYKLVTSKDFPSWGFMIEQGATTVWERWDGYIKGRKGGEFQDPGMNSFNHFAFGAIGEWMVHHIGGLSLRDESPDALAWRTFDIHPIPPPPSAGITWAKTTYKSIRGDIAVSWKIENGRFLMDITVPPNTSANVFIPTSDAESVKEGDRPASEAERVTAGGAVQGGARFSVRAGTYRFSANYK